MTGSTSAASNVSTPAESNERGKGGANSYLILAWFLLGTAILSWICAATGQEGVTGATVSQILSSPVNGFTSALPVCFFVIVLGGFLEVVDRTGALNTGIATLVKEMKGKELALIPILMVILGICGSTYGMCEETVPFYLLLGTALYAAGFDTMTSALTVLLGAGCGCIGSTVNPFSVGVAEASLADLGYDVDKGLVLLLGFIVFVIAEGSAVAFVMSYAKKVRGSRANSAMSETELAAMDAEFGEAGKRTSTGDSRLTVRQKWVLVAFVASFVVMIVSFIPWKSFGVTFFDAGEQTEDVVTGIRGSDIVATYTDKGLGTLSLSDQTDGTLTTTEETSPAWSSILTGAPLGDWYFNECTTWFLVMAIVIGIIGGLSADDIVKTFLKGCAGILDIALVIAFARAISILMSSTGLDVWILNTAATALSNVAATVLSVGSTVVYLLLSFAIPSSSGMATVSMPIMGPLAIKLGFSVEVMIVVYVVSHGIVLLFTPTFGVLLAGLAFSKIEYPTFVRVVGKYVIGLTVALVAFLTAMMTVL